MDERGRLRALGASRLLRLAVTRADLIRIEQLLLWLVRLILEVHARRESNKMALKNLTVVFAPNLRLLDTGAVANPLEELHNIEKVEKALHTLCTCLLYTSPSPRDVEESRMPSSA